jgi:hypothetical protein
VAKYSSKEEGLQLGLWIDDRNKIWREKARWVGAVEAMTEVFKVPIFTFSERFESISVFPPGRRRAMFNTKTKEEVANKTAI